jgi:hypothetical protein
MHSGTKQTKDRDLNGRSPLRIVWKRDEVRPAPWDRDTLEVRIREALANVADRMIEWTAPPRLVVVK